MRRKQQHPPADRPHPIDAIYRLAVLDSEEVTQRHECGSLDAAALVRNLASSGIDDPGAIRLLVDSTGERGSSIERRILGIVWRLGAVDSHVAVVIPSKFQSARRGAPPTFVFRTV